MFTMILTLSECLPMPNKPSRRSYQHFSRWKRPVNHALIYKSVKISVIYIIYIWKDILSRLSEKSILQVYLENLDIGWCCDGRVESPWKSESFERNRRNFIRTTVHFRKEIFSFMLTDKTFQLLGFFQLHFPTFQLNKSLKTKLRIHMR